MTYITNAWDTYQLMNENNILMSFVGNIDHQETTSLLRNFKKKINSESVKTLVNNKVYSVLVESIENISKHSTPESISIMLLSKTKDAYTVVTGNPIKNKNIPVLKEKLEKYSKLDNSELKKMYMNRLLSLSTNNSSEGSAGLGMLEMAIKSKNNLQYNFEPITEDISFYLLQIKVNIQ